MIPILISCVTFHLVWIMCLKPITIVNRSRRFRVGINRPTLVVPCGHCEQCQRRKSDDWFVRAVGEWNRVKKNGGFVWFPTLTYNNKSLPYWKDDECHFEAPVFDPAHFVAFRTKLRVYLKREGYNFKDDLTIRYIYCCEYGDHTGRSHLHCLLFVPQFVPFPLFKSLVQKAWIYGKVRYSPSGDVAHSVKALKYCMKYMHKDCVYYDKYKIDDYLKYLRGRCKDSDIKVSNFYKAKLKAFKSHLPCHRQSMGFGCTLCLTDDDFINNRVKASYLGLYDSTFEYKIPMYYKRKFLFDFDNVEKIYSLNPRGKHIKQEQFSRTLDSLDRYFSSVIYSNHVHDIVATCYPYLFDNPYYEYFEQLKSFDTKDISIFAMVYRGLALKKDVFIAMDLDTSAHFIKENNDNAYFYFCSSIDGDVIHSDYRSNGAKEAIDYFGYSDCNVYFIFERGLQFLELFERTLGESEDKALNAVYYRQQIQFGKLFNKV